MEKKFDIKIFVMPLGACSYENSWQYAVDMISKTLKDRVGGIFDMKLNEIFSPESYSYKEIMEGIQQEKYQTPVVTIDGKIIQSGGKLSERNLKFEIENLEEEPK